MYTVGHKMVNLYELLNCLSNATDLISPELTNHHKQVAYLAFKIAEEINLPRAEQHSLVLAGMLHDVGALSLLERLELLESEPPNASDHAFRGADLVAGFSPLAGVTDIIRYHHMPWTNGQGTRCCDGEVPYSSHIVHLADRIAVLVNGNHKIMGQIPEIRRKILEQKNTVFAPELVDAFVRFSDKEYIWLDMTYKPLLNVLPERMISGTMELDMDNVTALTKVFANIIDFRSPFTANHTAGVAKTAETLAELAGFSQGECRMMLVAGYLHDLGKLAIGKEILEKPGKLTEEEFGIVRTHTYYTYRLLQTIQGFETISVWAALHHEKLNGKGYPFHLTEESIPLGSRIVAVADIFTAITEDRPYRPGMTREQVVKVFNSMVANHAVCSDVVSLLMKNYEYVDERRKEAQRETAAAFDTLDSAKKIS